MKKRKSIREVIESVEIIFDKYGHSGCEATSCCYYADGTEQELYRDRIIEALQEAGYIPRKG